MAIENISQWKGVGNIGALDVDDQTKSAIKKSLVEGVDPAQLKYFKEENKDALSQAPPPPPPPVVEDTVPTKENIQAYIDNHLAGVDQVAAANQSKGTTQNVYEGVGDLLWGSPQMRGHIK